MGTWSTQKNVTIDNGGKLVVGDADNSGSLTANALNAGTKNTITVNTDSSFTANTIEASGSLTVAGEGILTIIGKDTSKDTTIKAGDNGYYGFGLKNVTVNVDEGTFVIGNTAAKGMLDEKWEPTKPDTKADDGADTPDTPNTPSDKPTVSQKYVYGNFGTYYLTNGGTLQVDFGKKEFSIEQYKQLKTELFGEDGLTYGYFDIGSATLGELTGDDSIIDMTDPENPTLTYEDYKEYNDKTDIFAGLTNEQLEATQMTGVNGPVNGINIGSIALAPNKDEVIFSSGASSLNKADEGNLIVKTNGEAGDADLNGQSILSLKGAGDVANVYLHAGTAKHETILNVDNKNNLESIEAFNFDGAGNPTLLDHTKVVIGSSGSESTADAYVAEDVAVSTLENNGQLTVGGENVVDGADSIWTNTLNNNGDFTVAAGNISVDKALNNAGNLTVAAGDVYANGTFNNASDGTLTVAAGDVTAQGTFSNAGTLKVTQGILTTKDVATNDGTLEVANGIEAQKAFTNNGTLNIDGAYIDSGNSVALDAEKAFANAGTLTVAKGNVEVAEVLSNAAEGTFDVKQGDVYVGNTLNNAGTLNVSGVLKVAKGVTLAEGSTTTANMIFIDDDRTPVYDANATSTTVAGTINVNHVNDNTDINATNSKLALDNTDNLAFVLDSNLKDSTGNIIKAVVSGTINAAQTSAGFANTNIVAGGNVTARNALFKENVIIGGTLTADRTIIGSTDYVLNSDPDTPTYTAKDTDAGDVLVTGTASLGDLRFINGRGTNEKGDVISNKRSSLTIHGGEVTAQDVFGDEKALIAVGSEKVGSQESSTGTLEITGVLHQNGASLVVDPDYSEKTAILAIRNLEGYNSSQNQADVGVFNGDVFVGKNSALGVGVSASSLRDLIAQFQVDGSLVDPASNAEGYGAILYLDGHTRINQKYGVTITADGQESALQSLRKFGTVGSDSYALANTIYLGSHAALAVNTEKPQSNEAYIRFVDDDDKDATNSKVIAAGGDILLYGNTFRRSYKLFDEGVTIVNGENASGSGTIDIASVNGLLIGELSNEDKGVVSLTINHEKANVILNGASAPVKETLFAYVRGYNGALDEDTSDGDDTDYLYDLDSQGNKHYDINNDFLSQVILEGNGADAEKVARAGIYAGAAQAALAAGASTYDAVSGRMGVGANGANLTVADNMQGGALWLTPIYKNNDSDGFGSEGVNYGVDLDLFGLALGADYTLPNGARFGAAFNVGSGDADGDGAGDGVSNDFDYYGFSVYGGYAAGPWSIIADLSYTTVDNDIEINTTQGKANTSLDSTNFSLGVTGQYQIEVNGLSVTPHAGLRYTQIDFDDYSIKGEDNEDIADFDADSMSIFSIPVGVTLSKEIVNGAWTIKPSFDLTLTCNFGDDEMEGTTHWAGIENLATPVASEVVDNFTYGATVGVAAKSGNFSLGFGLNYTGSSNTDEFGLNANARFVF